VQENANDIIHAEGVRLAVPSAALQACKLMTLGENIDDAGGIHGLG
jgi:hypothetical protein